VLEPGLKVAGAGLNHRTRVETIGRQFRERNLRRYRKRRFARLMRRHLNNGRKEVFDTASNTVVALTLRPIQSS
jgi:hypothetical protein